MAMDRRAFIAALLSALSATTVRGQPSKRPVPVGFLRIVPPPEVYVQALEQGLRERGYVPGRDVAIDYRFADGREEHLARLAKEMVGRKVAIIIAAGNQAVRAARDATQTIPIVMAVANDPVPSGLVASLAQPGGNITGTTIVSSTLSGKRLELLKQVLPQARRVAVLMNKDSLAHVIAWRETVSAAAPLQLEMLAFEVQGAAMLGPMFAAMVNQQAQAVVLFEDAMFVSERKRIVALAAEAKLPAIYGQRNSVQDGGFLSYGPNIEDAYRNAGGFVDRILKGASPAGMPIEQPTRFELVINLKVSKALGITIPHALLVRADEVIQ